MTQGYWAVANLILVLTSVFYAAMPYIEGVNKDINQDDASKRTFWRRFGVVFAAISAVAFFLTENITLPMRFTDDRTVFMALLTAAQIPGIIVRYSGNTEDVY